MPRIEQTLRCTGVAALAWLGVTAMAAADPLAPADLDFNSEAPLFDEPLDLSTPMPEHFRATIDPSRFTAGLPANGWSAKFGVDNRAALPDAALRPERWLPWTPEPSVGVGWANVTAPGVLTWDRTSVETRLDPDQQGRVGVTLSRSIPVGHSLSVTLQNGYAVTQSLATGGGALPHPPAAPAGGAASMLPSPVAVAPSAGAAAHIIEENHAVRFTVVPSDTTFSLGASTSSADDRWLRRLSAEQKLFGGPVNITGAVSELPTGELSKSLTAGFRQSW